MTCFIGAFPNVQLPSVLQKWNSATLKGCMCEMVQMGDVKSGGKPTLWSLSYNEIQAHNELIYYIFIHYDLWTYQERFRIFWSCQSYEYDDEWCPRVCTWNIFQLECYKNLESTRRIESYTTHYSWFWSCYSSYYRYNSRSLRVWGFHRSCKFTPSLEMPQG